MTVRLRRETNQTTTIMKTITTSIAAALLTTLACGAQEPERPQGPPPRPPHPPMPLLKALDADEDGKISTEEMEAATTALRNMDTDGDGAVTKEELRPKPQEGMPTAPKDDSYEAGPRQGPPAEDDKGGGGEARPQRPKHPVPPLMAAMDKNRDGKLSTEEISQAPESLVKLDRNGDGELTPHELHPPRPPREDGEEQEEAPRGPDRGGRTGRQGPPPGGR
jgi:Ca2+-binding EF-hand superfamily protein